MISDRLEFKKIYPDARLLALENHFDQSLWVLPGELQDKLNELGFLFSNPLPAQAYRSSLKFNSRLEYPIKISKENSQDITLSITHTGAGSPWPNRPGLRKTEGSVRIGVIYFKSENSNQFKRITESRFDLQESIFPFQNSQSRINININPSKNLFLEPGEYEVWIGLVQEGATWFYDKGDNVLKLPVKVEK